MDHLLCLLLVCSLATVTSVTGLEQAQEGQKLAAEKAQYLVQTLRNVQKPGIQMFMGEVSLGTPPQTFSVTLEVSTNFSYVPSISCKDSNCMMRRRYNSSSSSTFQEDGTPFVIPYSENITGIMSRDNFGLAGIIVKNKSFGEATHMLSPWLKYLPNDGGFGVGYNSELIEDLKKQEFISQRVFGMYFGSGNADGEVTLGGINEARHTGEIHYLDIVPESYNWMVRMDNMTIGEDNTICGSDGCMANFATSTPYFVLSMENAKIINEKLGAEAMPTPGSYRFDCTKLCDMPSLTVSIAGMDVTFSVRDYILNSNIGGGFQICLSGFLGTEQMPVNQVGLGTLFLQKVFTVYDRENSRMGFAPSK